MCCSLWDASVKQEAVKEASRAVMWDDVRGLRILKDLSLGPGRIVWIKTMNLESTVSAHGDVLVPKADL